MRTALIQKLLCLLLPLVVSVTAEAKKCKYEIKEADHLESRMLILYRGMTTGLAGYIGHKKDQTYFQGLYSSNFKGRATFTTETPLELSLADGRTLKLEVMTEAKSSNIHFGHVITVARDAKPIFSVTTEQRQALLESPVTSLHMSYYRGDELRETTQPVKPKRARKLTAALQCVLLNGKQ